MRNGFARLILMTALIVIFAHPVLAEDSPSFSLKKSRREVVVYVKNADDIEAFEVELDFNHRMRRKRPVVEIRQIMKGELLESSPRTFSMLGPKVDESGKVSFGFFSIGDAPGIQGEGVLARIKIRGNPSSLRITDVKAAGSDGRERLCEF